VTEDEAKAWLVDRNVPRETLGRLEAFANFLTAEASHQNLIAASTLDSIWSRHIVDSAQLLDLAPATGNWVDLGSGSGFPGLIVAALGRDVTLIESRAKRVQFLHEAASVLGVSDRVTIFTGRVETVTNQRFDIISARAFAPLPRLLDVAAPLSRPATCWLLPKGRSAAGELEAIAGTWQGDFRIVPSVTDPDAAIIVARDVRLGRRR